ncbi:MAG: hypothetical protein HY674_06695 [Chloroflexi bacterium]|nr:hypothetical protein [Chloroflexota bacterium]
MAEPKFIFKVTEANAEIQRLRTRVAQLETQLAQPPKPAPPTPHATSPAAELWRQYHALQTAAERRKFWEKNRAALQKPTSYDH